MVHPDISYPTRKGLAKVCAPSIVTATTVGYGDVSPQTVEGTAPQSHPAAHVLFALGDARRAGARHSGARRPSGSGDDAAPHALEFGGHPGRHSALGCRRHTD